MRARASICAAFIGLYGCGGTIVPDPTVFPDATSRDASPARDAATPDAAPSDGSPLDAGSFTVDLTASATTATTSAAILLTAVPLGLTATAVAFYDDDARIGVATPPFTISLSYAAMDNGVHALRAVAFAASGERANSDVLPIRVAIERGLYVDPASGDDTNPGTDASPLRTITRATQLATAGESIFLKDGVYGAGEPRPGNCIVIPPAVSVRAVRPGRARMVAVAAARGCALSVSDGLVEGIEFQDYEIALQFLSGTTTVRGVRVEGSDFAFALRGTARVTVSDPVVTGYVNTAFGVAIGVVEEQSLLTVQGGVFEGATTGIAMFMVRGDAQLVLEGTVLRDNARNAVRVSDSASLLLRDVTIDNCGRAAPGADMSSIFMGSLNSAPVRATSLRMERSRIVRAPGNGIGVVYYGNRASNIEVRLFDSAVTDSGRRGLFVNPIAMADPALVITLEIQSSTVSRNAGGGILAGLSALDIRASLFSGNDVEIGASFHPSSLRVHDSTFVDSEITVSPGMSSACDLGTAAVPGANVFRPSGMMMTALRLDAPVSCTAVGSTWLAMVQGADANGRYPAAGSSVAGPTMGANYTLVTGASLER